MAPPFSDSSCSNKPCGFLRHSQREWAPAICQPIDKANTDMPMYTVNGVSQSMKSPWTSTQLCIWQNSCTVGGVPKKGQTWRHHDVVVTCYQPNVESCTQTETMTVEMYLLSSCHVMCHSISICVEASQFLSFQLPLLDVLLLRICLFEQRITLHPSLKPVENCVLALSL